MKLSTCMGIAVSAMVMVVAMMGNAGAEPGRSGWYVGGGIGASWTSGMDHVGWNRDTYCYPDFGCEPVGLSSSAISGYRWMYDLDLDAGIAFEVSVGRMFNRWRVEFSAAQRNNAIDQQFKALTNIDGSPLAGTSSPSGVESNTMSRIDDLTTRTLSVNAYYDFTDLFERITPYVGVGLGVSFVELSGTHFSTRHVDPSDPSPERAALLSNLDSEQNADISDTVFVGNFYAGTDYSLTDETLLGVKLTYSIMDDVEHMGHYSKHPMHAQDPAFSNTSTFSGPQQFSAMVTVKYLFGD